MKYTVQGNVLTFVMSDKKIEFDFEIGDCIEFEQCLIVRLQVPPKACYNENVFSYDYKGNMLWQVEKIEHIYNNSPYVKLGYKGPNVLLYNWDGTVYLLNPLTGETLLKRWMK